MPCQPSLRLQEGENFLDASDIASRWPFALGLTIFLLSFTYLVLARSNVQQFYLQSKS